MRCLVCYVILNCVCVWGKKSKEKWVDVRNAGEEGEGG